MAHLVSIVYKPASPANGVGEDGYFRVPLPEARLVAGRGIEGDTKGSKSRQLNIISTDSTESLTRDGFRTRPGQLGEQLIVAGLDIEGLAAGTCLRIGDAACVKLIKLRTGCSRFEKHQNKSKKEAAGRIGMIASVSTGGVIRVGDAVNLVEGTSASQGILPGVLE